MDRGKVLEEDLREASCKGDLDAVLELVSKGININAQHVINGWTALHWAASRGHRDIVQFLLEQGADPSLKTEKGETALGVCSANGELRALLGGDMNSSGGEGSTLAITPSYLKNPPLNPKVEYQNGVLHRRQPDHSDPYLPHSCDELVLKVRVANNGDPDFIEIELGRSELTYYSLLRVCCEELGLNASQVVRLRKLPDTMLRKDKDIQRLSPMQEIEVVVTSAKHQPNGYKSIQLYKNQTILY